MSELFGAATNGQVDVIKRLLAEGVDVNRKDNSKWTALMLASRYSNTTSNLQTVKLLIDSGADLNLQNNNEWTALMLASVNSSNDSSVETVKLLIESGADLNIKDDYGRTALIKSVIINTNSLETVKLLLYASSERIEYVNITDAFGGTALGYAKDLETVLLLLDAGASPFINTNRMLCQSEECLRAVETAAWKQIFKRDLQTAQILGKSILNKEVWQLILIMNVKECYVII